MVSHSLEAQPGQQGISWRKFFGWALLFALIGRSALDIPPGLSMIMVIVGLIFVFTAYIGTCLAYIPLNKDTRADDEK